MRSRILIGLLAGTLGGFLGWLLQENLINYNAHIIKGILPGQGAISQGLSVEETRTLIYCVGGMIGLCLGVVEGIVEGNVRKLMQGMIVGAIAGIILGYVGFNLGAFLYEKLGGNSAGQSADVFAFVRQVLARSFGWSLMGLGLGVGSAISTRSPRRIRNGAIGGFLGGFLGGFVFDLLAQGANPVQGAVGASGPHDIGGPSRMVGFTAIGGLTGFFIGLVEEWLKQAWVKVLAGRNEGKDYILSKTMNILGRDERSDVPLFGDMTIGVQHAVIRADGNRHVLMDGSTPAGTVVNGQRVTPGGEMLLRDGDMIQIGSQRILFREKATANKYARQPVDAPKAKSGGGSMPMPAHLCPFCGAPKDANGGCLCSPASAPAGATNNSAPAFPPANSGVGAGVGSSYGTGSNGYGAQPAYGGIALPGGGPSMPRLVGMEGPYAGQVFLLTETNIIVGREPDRDIVLSADTTISRNHARLTREGADFVVYDNGSSNGTYVNGQRISMQLLATGDMVQFGSSKFRYE